MRLIRSYYNLRQVPKYESKQLSKVKSGLGQGVHRSGLPWLRFPLNPEAAGACTRLHQDGIFFDVGLVVSMIWIKQRTAELRRYVLLWDDNAITWNERNILSEIFSV